MPNTDEQRLDLIENCNLLLNGILAPFEQTDNTPEGRMISQLKWLKERAENHDLSLPVDQDSLASIRYIYTDGELCRHASDSNDRNTIAVEVETPMGKIIDLAKYGSLLYKPEYELYAIRSIDRLIATLKNSKRKLTSFEADFTQELTSIKTDLANKEIAPPLGGCAKYINLIESEDTINDIPNAKIYFHIFFNIIFNGTRPDSWLTPELADKETKNYLS